MLKNSKAKGNRNEHRTMKVLESAGYYCCRAAASLGVFDVVAINANGIRLVQVKSNKWPSPAERETMLDCRSNLPANATIEAWRWNDHQRKPMIRVDKELREI